MITTIYAKNDVGIKGDTAIVLSEREANMMFNALSICFPKEVDSVPIILLCDKLVKANKRSEVCHG